MKLFELAIGPEDYDRRWIVRLTLMGFGVEAGWGIVVGYFVALEWQWPTLIAARTGWWDSWCLGFHHWTLHWDWIRHWWAYTLEDLRSTWNDKGMR